MDGLQSESDEFATVKNGKKVYSFNKLLHLIQ